MIMSNVVVSASARLLRQAAFAALLLGSTTLAGHAMATTPSQAAPRHEAAAATGNAGEGASFRISQNAGEGESFRISENAGEGASFVVTQNAGEGESFRVSENAGEGASFYAA
jgi:hypothetical protein